MRLYYVILWRMQDFRKEGSSGHEAAHQGGYGLGACPPEKFCYFGCSEVNFGRISAIDRLGTEQSCYHPAYRKIVTDAYECAHWEIN